MFVVPTFKVLFCWQEAKTFKKKLLLMTRKGAFKVNLDCSSKYLDYSSKNPDIWISGYLVTDKSRPFFRIRKFQEKSIASSSKTS